MVTTQGSRAKHPSTGWATARLSHRSCQALGKLVLGEVVCLGPELEGNMWVWPELTLIHSPTPCCLSPQVFLSAGTCLARLETTISGMGREGQGEPSRWTRPGGGERVGSLEAGAGLAGENGEAVWLAGGEVWNRDRCHSRDGSEADGAGGAEPMSQDSSLGEMWWGSGGVLWESKEGGGALVIRTGAWCKLRVASKLSQQFGMCGNMWCSRNEATQGGVGREQCNKKCLPFVASGTPLKLSTSTGRLWTNHETEMELKQWESNYYETGEKYCVQW